MVSTQTLSALFLRPADSLIAFLSDSRFPRRLESHSRQKQAVVLSSSGFGIGLRKKQRKVKYFQ